MSYPRLPSNLRAIAQDLWGDEADAELSGLWAGIVAEVTNPAYSRRTHMSRRTYDAGCDGPVCKLEVRRYSRRRIAAQATQKSIVLDSATDYFYQIAKAGLDLFTDQLKERLLEIDAEYQWNESTLSLKKEEAV